MTAARVNRRKRAALSLTLTDCVGIAVQRCSASAAAEQLPAAAAWGAVRIGQTNIWVGDAADARNKAMLDATGISAVINVAKDVDDYAGAVRVPIGSPRYGGMGLSVLRLEHLDRAEVPIHQGFLPAAEFAQSAIEAGSQVLIHCRSGISRAPVVAVAVLQILSQRPLHEVFAAVRTSRPRIDPNIGFLNTLQRFQSSVVDIRARMREHQLASHCSLSQTLQCLRSEGLSVELPEDVHAECPVVMCAMEAVIHEAGAMQCVQSAHAHPNSDPSGPVVGL